MPRLLTIEARLHVHDLGRREFAVRDTEGNLLVFSAVTDDLPTCKE